MSSTWCGFTIGESQFPLCFPLSLARFPHFPRALPIQALVGLYNVNASTRLSFGGILRVQTPLTSAAGNLAGLIATLTYFREFILNGIGGIVGRLTLYLERNGEFIESLVAIISGPNQLPLHLKLIKHTVRDGQIGQNDRF